LLARSVVAFSPTDDLLAVGSMRPVAEPVRLLDPDGLRPLRPVLDIPGIAGVRDLAISANGDHLAALLIPEPPADAESSPPPTAMVWDLRGGDGTPVASLELPEVYQGMAISPDGLTVYTSGPAAAYDVTSGERLWRREDVGSFFTSDLSPDGALLALNKQDHAAGYVVPVLDTRTGETRLVLRGARDTVRDLRFSRSGELLVAGTRDGEILVFDTKRGRVRERWSGDETVWSVDFSPDGELIFAGGSSGMLRTWDLQSGSTYLERIAVAGAPRDYVFADLSHDGNRAAYRWLDRKGQGWVRFVETHTGAVTPPAPMPLQDGPWVAGSWTSDDSAYAAHAGCVTPCSFGGTVTVFDPATGRARVSETVIPELDDDDNIIFAMTHTPDDSHLLAGDLNGEMSVIDADDLESHGETLGDAVDCCLTPVPRSDRLVYLDGSDDGAYDRWRLFDVDTGRDVTGGDLAFRAFDVAAAPDGRNIVVVGRWGRSPESTSRADGRFAAPRVTQPT
jgi:WD40 repeat protein